MTITKPMIMDILSGFAITEYNSGQETFNIEKVAFLSSSIKELKPTTLYIASASQLRMVKQTDAPDVCVICAGKPAVAEKFLQAHRVQMLLLPEDTDIYDIANLVSENVNRLNRWENKLRTLIVSGQSLQKIAEVGREIYGENPVVLGSSSYNIVGRSLTETPNNPKVSNLLKRGYFIKEEADMLSRMGYQSHRYQYREPVLVNPPSLMNCSFFLVAYPASLKEAAFMAVYFVSSKPTEGQMDIFRFYSALVRQYCEDKAKDGEQLPSALEVFMDDLLLHTHEDDAYLIDRAKQLQLPPNESYRIGLIQWDEYSRDQAEYVLWRVRSGLGKSVYRVMRYHESVLMIVKGSMPHSQVVEKMNEAVGQFSEILSVCNGHIGFSTEVESLLQLDVAYKQACAAVKYGKQMGADEDLLFYSKYYIYDMIDSYTDKYKIEDMFVQKLKLLDTEEEGRYNNLNLLRYYLLSERSLSVTARLLHLHRNSVIYRLGKIENILGVDLDDPDVRLRLLISFKIMEHVNGVQYPAIPLETEIEE